MERQFISREGYDRLTKELEHIKKVERPANVQAIADARAHGDLSENAEFHAAKERQAVIQARMVEIESVLATAQLVDPLPEPQGKVVFGARVTVYDTNTEDEATYQVVGQSESDASNGRISLSSPLAKALMGKEEGDEIRFNTPGGVRILEIVSVE